MKDRWFLHDYDELHGSLLCVFHMMLDLGTDRIPSGEPLEKINVPIRQKYTDKCHYKSPLVTRTITIVIIIIIFLNHICGDIFFLPHSGSKNR